MTLRKASLEVQVERAVCLVAIGATRQNEDPVTGGSAEQVGIEGNRIHLRRIGGVRHFQRILADESRDQHRRGDTVASGEREESAAAQPRGEHGADVQLGLDLALVAQRAVESELLVQPHPRTGPAGRVVVGSRDDIDVAVQTRERRRSACPPGRIVCIEPELQLREAARRFRDVREYQVGFVSQRAEVGARWHEELVAVQDLAPSNQLLHVQDVFVRDRQLLQHQRLAFEDHRLMEAIAHDDVLDHGVVRGDVPIHQRNHFLVAAVHVHHRCFPLRSQVTLQREDQLVDVRLVQVLDAAGRSESLDFVESKQSGRRQRIALRHREAHRRVTRRRAEVGPDLDVVIDVGAARPVEQSRKHGLVIAPPVRSCDQRVLRVQPERHADPRLDAMIAQHGDALAGR